MKSVLVTGGTVFVTRTIAEYYAGKGYCVYVLNRNTKKQPDGVTLIEADRHDIGDRLKNYKFDIVIDHAYTGEEVEMLVSSIGEFRDYILISSSAVYPEYEKQPFTEDCELGENKFWGKYGTDKIAAERALLERFPTAYIIRPPYLYGPLNNVYREAFVFDCAMADRKFYLPEDGEMRLQFLHVRDLCRFIDILAEKKPDCHIYNVGNRESVTIKEWVRLCYKAVGKSAEFENVYDETLQRNYFSFHNYEYYLDVSKQEELMPETTDLYEGLKEAFEWYKDNSNMVSRKNYIEYIEDNL